MIMTFKKHPILVVVLFLPPITLALVILYLNYKKMDIGEYITLFAGLLTYLGTVILSMVTLVQNEGLLSLESHRADIEERKLREENHPKFIIEELRCDGVGSEEVLKSTEILKSTYEVALQGEISKPKRWLYVSLKNISSAEACNCKYYDYSYLELVNSNAESYIEQCVSKVKADGSIVLGYLIEEGRLQSFIYDLRYRNIYGYGWYNQILVFVSENDGKINYQVAIGPQMEGEGNSNIDTYYS